MTSPRSQPSLIALLRHPQQLLQLTLGEWDLVLRLARSANLMSHLAWRLRSDDLEASLPPEVQPHVTAALRLMDHQLQAVRWECHHLEQALAGVAGSVVLLKGAAYVMAGRVAAQGRLFGDIDLMVERASLPQVEAALMLHGWSTGKVDPYDQRYYRTWMHELPPMAHHARGTVVDVHHNILPLTAKHVPDAQALLDTSKSIQGSRFRVLAHRDMVIHSAVHLFHEGELKNGLRDLFDLDALLVELTKEDPGAWSSLVDRASDLGLVWPLYLALRYCAKLIGTAVPDDVMAFARTASTLGALQLRWLDALYLRALTPLHPNFTTTSTGLAQSALFVRGHALRMPLGRLTVHLARKAFMRSFKRSSRVG